MKPKLLHIVGLGLIAAFAAYGSTGLRGAMTPYVDITQAKATTDRVQVKGNLDKASITHDSVGRLLFRLKDFKSGQWYQVRYTGPEHANMGMARDVVAMGTWNPGLNEFEADEMNIKCPDKYATGAGVSKTAKPL